MPIVIIRPRDDEDDEPGGTSLVDLAGMARRARLKRLSTRQLEDLCEEASRRLRVSEEALRDFRLHKALRSGKFPRGKAFREEWR